MVIIVTRRDDDDDDDDVENDHGVTFLFPRVDTENNTHCQRRGNTLCPGPIECFIGATMVVEASAVTMVAAMVTATAETIVAAHCGPEQKKKTE